MDKTTLKFKADEQRLVGGQALFASDTINYIEAEFELGENWSGYDSVRAVWHTNHDSISTVLNEFGHCVVPQEVLRREGKVEVNLVGSIASGDVLTDRLTTYPIVAIVVDAKAKLYSTETSPITPSQFEQFASIIHDDAVSAASSASDAATSASEAAASATRASNSDADATRRANQAYNYANAAERAKTAAESARDSAQSYRDGALNAVQAASQAAGTAQTASSNANIYASRASESATNASQSASQAESAKNTILNMTVSAESLPEGSSATVVYYGGHMGFGIPKGDKGDRGNKGDTGETGATPQMSIGTVETLAPDEDASVTIRGTAEAPILDFGLPKGETGDKGDKGDTGEVSLLELIANTKVDEVSDSVPYQMRTLSGVGSHESLRKIVGGTVAWNQLVTNGDFSDGINGWSGNRCTISVTNNVLSATATEIGTDSYSTNVSKQGGTINLVSGHRILFLFEIKPAHTKNMMVFVIKKSGQSGMNPSSGWITTTEGKWNQCACVISLPTETEYNYPQFALAMTTANGYSVGDTDDLKNINAIDLTAMFGTTIADYIYSLEQAHAGDGGAFFKALFPDDYYPYDEGTLKSVQTTAHKTYDADGNVIGNYPLDSSITLMGVPKLDASNNLYYDGDTYESDGTVTRKYGIVDLGTLNWSRNTTNQYFAHLPATGTQYTANQICTKYLASARGAYDGNDDKAITVTGSNVWARDTAYPSATGTEFKTAMSGVYLVYELATPTTETASPYTELQEVESGGSEEFVGAEIPVGHESVYPRTLADTMPTADGSYTLSLTVSGGKPKVEWEVSQ